MKLKLRISFTVAAATCFSLSAHVAQAAPTSLYAVSGSNILELNPNTGATLNSFTPPTFPQNGGGSGLAFSGSELFYTSIDTPTIFRLDPTSGAVLGSFARPLAATGIDGLGYGPTSFGPTLFALDYTSNNLYLLNPLTGTQFTSFLLGFDAIGGVDFDHVTNRVFVSDVSGSIRQLNPNTGAVLSTMTITPFQFGIGLVGNRLFTTDSGHIYERNSTTGAIINTFPTTYPIIGALAGGPPVPEPQTIVMLLMGASVFAGRLNRRRGSSHSTASSEACG